MKTTCGALNLVVVCILLGSSAWAQTAPGDGRSLGDIAREMREKKFPDVQITSSDVKALFAAVDEIVDFAAKDSGFRKHLAVKRQMVGRQHVEAYFKKGFDEEQQNIAKSELVMKKMGLLAPDFDMGAFFAKNSAPRGLGGYYDPKDRTMYLLDWIPLDRQKPIMAHELTHALQDQNYDLTKLTAAKKLQDRQAPQMSFSGRDEGERSTASRAMVEGQAMLVYYDWMLKPSGRSLADAPRWVLSGMSNSLQDYDLPVALNNGPRVFKETSIFPYRDGLSFALELLQKGGKEAAFTDAFARPPQTTHEVLDPDFYLSGAKAPVVAIPDLRTIGVTSYTAYDSGGVGELDSRIMAREFGKENDIFSVGAQWKGGGYVVVKRPGVKNDAKLTTADLALLYLSRWKTFESARRMAQLYQQALPKRAKVTREELLPSKCGYMDEKCKEPLWAMHMQTSEGLVILEVWSNNTLLIMQSFDEESVGKIRRAVLTPRSSDSPAPRKRELHASLWELPSFLAFQDEVGREFETRLAAVIEKEGHDETGPRGLVPRD